MPDTVQNNCVVSIAYTLRVDGNVVDEADAAEPLEYLHGADNIVPGLESALEGLRVGERKDVRVTPEEGYGVYDNDDVEVLPRREFPDDMPLEVGMLLSISDDDGYFADATVKAFNEREVTLDYNHPLAGKELHFNVEVVGIREATDEEIAHGHVHGGDIDDEFGWEDDDDEFEDEFVDEDEADDSPPSRFSQN
ncbi:MAG: peptidylprolyl isomerase [Anaerolineae bacterium]